MKILLITIDYPPPYGGIATFTKTIENELKQLGHTVEILNFDSRNTSNYKFLTLRDLLYTRATKNSHFNLKNILNPKKLLDFEGGFRDFIFNNMVYRVSQKKIGNFQPDLIHLLHCRIYTSVFDTSVPFVISCYSEELKEYFPVKYVLTNAKKIHCISNFTKNKVLEISPEQLKNITVIPVSIKSDSYTPTHSENFRLLTICRLDKAKNVISIINSFQYLPKKILDNVSYSIVGIGEEFETLKNRIVELGLQKMITLLGKVSEEDKRELITNSTVFIMCPTPYEGKQEGFGIVYLEARASELPIIASKTGGVPEAVGTCGVLVNNELNPKEIASKIELLYSDKKLFSQLKSNCRSTKSSLDDRVMMTKMLDLYNSI